MFSLEVKNVDLFQSIFSEIVNDCEIKDFQMLTPVYMYFIYLCHFYLVRKESTVFLTSGYQEECNF